MSNGGNDGEYDAETLSVEEALERLKAGVSTLGFLARFSDAEPEFTEAILLRSQMHAGELLERILPIVVPAMTNQVKTLAVLHVALEMLLTAAMTIETQGPLEPGGLVTPAIAAAYHDAILDARAFLLNQVDVLLHAPTRQALEVRARSCGMTIRTETTETSTTVAESDRGAAHQVAVDAVDLRLLDPQVGRSKDGKAH